MIEKRPQKLWDQLRGRKPHVEHFLSAVHLRGIRGIESLRVAFEFPVSVIAGGNASGKSTVLFAAACAYRVPGAGVRDFVPSTLFPDYRPKVGDRSDRRTEVILDFDYSTPEGARSMRWRRRKGWNRSFMGRKGATQPERVVYLRTLSNLSNPSEVRGILSMSRSNRAPAEKRLTASQIEFAQRILPFRYAEVVNLSSGAKSLLFAEQDGGTAYSELHMAAGERSVLRLSQEIAQLSGALVLIDEVEVGLHPWVQKLLMLHLQQLALRNDLQIVVTTHSPVVLESVPPEGRIFLDRDSETGRVSVCPPYRDFVQNALYGRSGEALNILCEDEVAEAILRGLFDLLGPRHGVNWDSIRIGRDTGAGEFPTHAAAFKKFGQIDNFIFVLDGDQHQSGIEQKIERVGGDVLVLFLPGRDSPEVWVWEFLRDDTGSAAAALTVNRSQLVTLMDRCDSIFDSASDTRSQIAKAKLENLSESLDTTVADICRRVARAEANTDRSEIQPLLEDLENALLRWRAD